MRAVRALLVRACLRIYPRSWRDRYADEVLVLTEDTGAGIGDLADLAFGGLRRRAHELHGGAPMRPLIRSATVILAALVALPTAAFIGLQLVNPSVALMPQSWANWLIPVLPAAGLLIALAPVVRIGLGRDEVGAMTVTARVMPMRRSLMGVVTLCLVLLGVVVAYGISENLLEALR
jgi:hypothetical protein